MNTHTQREIQTALKHQAFCETLSLFGAIYIRQGDQFINIAQVTDIHTERATAQFNPDQDYFAPTSRPTEYFIEESNADEADLFGVPVEMKRHYFRKL